MPIYIPGFVLSVMSLSHDINMAEVLCVGCGIPTNPGDRRTLSGPHSLNVKPV